MNTIQRQFAVTALMVTISAAFAQVPLGSEFTYQGRLKFLDQPLNGTADIEFTLWDADSAGNMIGVTQSMSAVSVEEGLFTVALDFGPAAFNGDARWLEVAVRHPAGSGGYTILNPRQPLTAAPYALQTRGILVDDTGRVAINGDITPIPNSGLDVHGGHVIVDNNFGIFSLNSDGIGFGAGLDATPNDQLDLYAGGTQRVRVFGTGAMHIDGEVQSLSGGFRFPDGSLQTTAASGTGSSIWSTSGVNAYYSGGNVGVGSPNFVNPFVASRYLIVNGPNTGSFPGSAAVVLHDTVRNRQWSVAINTGGALQLHKSGDGSNEVILPVLRLLGGSDIAEPFNVNGGEKVEPGMVVTIDPDKPGTMRVASKAHDKTVAGIISGAGGVNVGMTLSQSETIADGEHPVALTGRVYCYVDADANGGIVPGDMLTTSNTPGHAMKVIDHHRAAGAIIGKAMSSLENGRGLVLVLVNLQ
ncbi:MAG: hypothetical protein MI923_21340 [Phycisphaerales bacterium]|nr:hypothetical protein [Phycisphaerales bacterium]